MSIFPPEMHFEIVLRLPAKDVIRFLCVSKAWYAMIHDQRFIKAHLQRSIESNSDRTVLLRSYKPEGPPSDFFSLALNNDDETIGTAVIVEQPLKCPNKYTDIMGNYSVHGLVCIHNDDDTNIALWNPSIKKFKKIPSTTFEPPPSESDLEMQTVETTQYGFGYDSLNNDYKVVGIAEFADINGTLVSSQVQIYSLKSDSWKRIQNMPCNYFGLSLSEHMVFLNGALIWTMHDEFDEDRCKIITLDLASEKYRPFSTPIDLDDNLAIGLEVLGSCLCFCFNHIDTRHDVWIMKEYGVAGSWTLLYSIEEEVVPWVCGHLCKPLLLSKSGEMVLLTDDSDVFYWFDLEKKSYKQVEFPDRPSSFERTTVYVGSLCLLDGDPVTVERLRQAPSTC